MSGDAVDDDTLGDRWFRELTEMSGDFFFRLRMSPTRAFEVVGDQAEQYFGYPAEAFLADADLVERLIVPADLPMVHERFSQHSSGDIDTDLHWWHRDGHLVHTHLWVRRRIRADGSMVLEGIARDLTALHTARESIDAERRKYQAIAETMNDAVIVVDVDTLLTEYVSPSIEGITGYTPDEILGTRFGVAGAITDEDAEFLRVAIAENLALIEAGERSVTEVTTLEIPHVHKNGGQLWLEINSRYHKDPRTGRYELWTALRDITSRKRALDALAESERRYRLLAEHASDVVFMRDPAGIITWVSPSITTVLGWRDTDVLGHDTLEFVHRDDVATVRAMRAATMAERLSTGLVARIRDGEGRHRYMSMASRAVHDDDGSVVAVVVGLRDVDELVRERERAERDEAILRAMADARITPQALFRAVRDDSGDVIDLVVTDVNRAACEHLGGEREEIIGQPLLDDNPHIAESGLFGRLATVVETGEPVLLHDIHVALAPGAEPRRLDVSAARVDDGLTVDWDDITDRAEAADRVAESERRYRLLAENSLDVIVHYRGESVVWASPSLTEALGWQPADWVGQSIGAFLHGDDIDAHSRHARTLLAGKPVIARYRVRAANGDFHWIETHAKPYLDEAGDPDGIVASFRTIDLEVRAEEELERRARYDDLTGLLKRNEALARLTVRGGRRAPGEQRAVLFIDVDGLKEINDTYGHRAGDAVLRALSGRITDSVRDSDPVARMGGDEFLVIVENVHDASEAHAVAEKIRAAVSAPVVVGGEVHTATVSIGVTLARPEDSADEVVARADQAMYLAKQSGRNRVRELGGPEA